MITYAGDVPPCSLVENHLCERGKQHVLPKRPNVTFQKTANFAVKSMRMPISNGKVVSKFNLT